VLRDKKSCRCLCAFSLRRFTGRTGLRSEGMPVKAGAISRSWGGQDMAKAIPSSTSAHVATIGCGRRWQTRSTTASSWVATMCAVCRARCVEYGYTFADELAAEVASRK
jgi:hypothetical protein